MINKLLGKLGLRLSKIPRNYSPTFRPELERFESMGNDREWKQLMMYSSIFSQIIDVPGDIAEFGVSTGTSLKALVRLANIYNESLPHPIAKKKVFGFDSFEGLSDIDFNDDPNNKGLVKKGEFKSKNSLEDLKYFLQKYKFCEIVEGYFEKTLSPFLLNNGHVVFSLIHIDCDIYKATKVVLENSIERLSIGGIILFDEIFNEGYPGETVAFTEFYNTTLIKKGIKLDFIRSKEMPWKWYCKRIT